MAKLSLIMYGFIGLMFVGKKPVEINRYGLRGEFKKGDILILPKNYKSVLMRSYEFKEIDLGSLEIVDSSIKFIEQPKPKGKKIEDILQKRKEAVNIENLEEKKYDELREIAKEVGVKWKVGMKKVDLIAKIKEVVKDGSVTEGG